MPVLRNEQILVRPVITEENTTLMERDQYTFEVHPDSNKIQIKAAVQATFDVKVKAVNVMNVKPSKKSRMIRRGAGRISGTTRGWKKAIVTLEAGNHIDIFEQV
jgi:large subunit ribosomal protein L23